MHQVLVGLTRDADVEHSSPFLPAIRQQPSLASPQAAPCRFDSIRLLTSADGRQRVGTRCGMSGWLVNGRQGVRVHIPSAPPQVNGPPLR